MRIQSEKYVDKYIMDALFILMARKKFDDISVTEITEKAGVGRASFYRNFSSKEDIVEKWISSITENFLQDSKISYQNDSAYDFFIKLFTHLAKYKEYSSLIYKANLTHLLKKEFDNKFLSAYKAEYNDYKSYFLAGGVFNVYYYWLINEYQESPQELAEKLVELI